MSLVKLRSNGTFAVYWLARTISVAGSGITVVILPVLVYRITGSPAAVATLNAIQALPYLAFGLLAGALADRLNRKKMMVICDVAAALLLVAVPVAAMLHLLTLAQLFILALGIGTAYVWFDAANFGSLPALVDRDQLPAAISLLESSATIALLIGPTLGGLLLAVMAPPHALGFDAVSYLMSALLLSSIRRPFRRTQHDQGPRKLIHHDIAEGLRFLWHQPVIRTITFSVFCTCVSWGGTFGLLVVYADRALHITRDNLRLGLLYSAGEIGSLIAAAAVPKLLRHLAIGRLLAAFLAANVVTLAMLSLAPSYGWALLLFCCYELVYVVVLLTGITVRQMLTPDHLQSRVNTTGRLLAYAGQPTGAVLGGLLAELLPIRLTFGLMAIGVAVGAMLAGWSCRRSGSLSVVSLSAPASVSLESGC
jgi:predicted MFS family arabinose efflux permease